MLKINITLLPLSFSCCKVKSIYLLISSYCVLYHYRKVSEVARQLLEVLRMIDQIVSLLIVPSIYCIRKHSCHELLGDGVVLQVQDKSDPVISLSQVLLELH